MSKSVERFEIIQAMFLVFTLIFLAMVGLDSFLKTTAHTEHARIPVEVKEVHIRKRNDVETFERARVKIDGFEHELTSNMSFNNSYAVNIFGGTIDANSVRYGDAFVAICSREYRTGPILGRHNASWRISLACTRHE